MSTILEMAQVVRAGGYPVDSQPAGHGRVDGILTKNRVADSRNLFNTPFRDPAARSNTPASIQARSGDSSGEAYDSGQAGRGSY